MPTRFTKMAPTRERFGSSRETRTTAKLLAGAGVSPVRVCMSRRPTLKPPSLPDRRAPPAIGTTSPAEPDPDPAREEELHLARGAERELPRVLEEEGPLLRVEEAEAVEVDLLLVDLDLREVGVHRGVEGEARRDAPLQVAARGGRRVAGLPERRLLGRLPERVGQQLEVALRRVARGRPASPPARPGTGRTGAGAAPSTSSRCAGARCAGSSGPTRGRSVARSAAWRRGSRTRRSTRSRRCASSPPTPRPSCG